MHALMLTLVTTLSVATVLGLVIGYFYARIYRGLLLSMSFVHTCVVTVPLVATAIYTVRTIGIGLSNPESQALAFALVGLLGLVRFRTVVRDTREFTFIFLAIISGLAAGSEHYTTAAIACVLVLGILFVLQQCGFGMPAAPSFRVRLTSTAPEARVQDYVSALATVADRIDTIAVRQEEAKTITYLFECMARSGQDIACVFESVRRVVGTEEVNVSVLQRGRGGDTEG